MTDQAIEPLKLLGPIANRFVANHLKEHKMLHGQTVPVKNPFNPGLFFVKRGTFKVSLEDISTSQKEFRTFETGQHIDKACFSD